MIAVIGASGQTGRATAEQLLAAGEKIRAIGRSAARLQPLVDRGAEAAVGDVADAAFLTRAFAGADAVYLLFPPDYTDSDYFGRYERITTAFVEALTQAKVTHAVLISSLGADHSAGVGPIVGLHRAEERLKSVHGLNLLILRPGYFYENLLHQLALIKHQGLNGGAEAPDAPIAAAATADIGAAAAQALRARDFSGVTIRELTGPADLTMREATRIIGERIGRPDLPYVQFPPDAFVDGLTKATGFPVPIAHLFLEMAQAFNDGRITRLTPRTPDTTGPTSFAQWVDEALVPAYQKL